MGRVLQHYRPKDSEGQVSTRRSGRILLDAMATTPMTDSAMGDAIKNALLTAVRAECIENWNKGEQGEREFWPYKVHEQGMQFTRLQRNVLEPNLTLLTLINVGVGGVRVNQGPAADGLRKFPEAKKKNGIQIEVDDKSLGKQAYVLRTMLSTLGRVKREGRKARSCQKMLAASATLARYQRPCKRPAAAETPTARKVVGAKAAPKSEEKKTPPPMSTKRPADLPSPSTVKPVRRRVMVKTTVPVDLFPAPPKVELDPVVAMAEAVLLGAGAAPAAPKTASGEAGASGWARVDKTCKGGARKYSVWVSPDGTQYPSRTKAFAAGMPAGL